MKKSFLIVMALIAIVFVGGCEKVSDGLYVEGTYEGTAIDTYGGEENLASAKIEVDSNGHITSVYLDTEYRGSTKKTLGDDYNMKTYNPSAAGEWYEQVSKLEKAIVDNQGIDFITLDSEGHTDTVSGCTIKIDALYEALSKALESAKK